MYQLIAVQGRIADRKQAAARGAAMTAEALAARYRLQELRIGTPTPHAVDHWSASLAQATETLSGLKAAVNSSFSADRVPLIVAGTCAASLATLPAAAAHAGDTVVLWFDAHADFHTPSSTMSGYLGGMVLAAACGFWNSGHGAGLTGRQIVLVGARDIDDGEEKLLRQAGVRILPPSEVTPEAVGDAIGDNAVWIHLDWDVLEPGVVATDFAVPGGLVPSQLSAVLAAISPAKVRGLELAEFCPSAETDAADRALPVMLAVLSPLFRDPV